ncbi:MAG: hypothetical protein NZ827_06000 [Aquificaceae bacterium]|nr:hypothetical protein [Aquificaceae bacterium]
MVREALKLLFLIVSYNFTLHYLSLFLSFYLFPNDLEGLLMVISLNSALYLAWLFGYREKTVVWLAYVYLFQVIGLSVFREEYHTITKFLPSLLITLFLIWLFESPVERRTKKLEEERKRLEEELSKNQSEISGLFEQMNLLRELTHRLNIEKEMIEREYRRLREEELAEKERLERERAELMGKLEENHRRLKEYSERLERLTRVNRELFDMLDALQEREPRSAKDELSRLRQERKRLSKELVQLHELIEELIREKKELGQDYENLRQTLEKEKREKEALKLEVENLRVQWEGKKEVYREMFESLLENVELEERVVREFLHLNREARKEFLRELFLLNMKGYEERFETMKGYRNVFKLKPMGGRIYFTFGENRRWKVIGILWGEEDKLKERYARELLVKYKD